MECKKRKKKERENTSKTERKAGNEVYWFLFLQKKRWRKKKKTLWIDLKIVKKKKRRDGERHYSLYMRLDGSSCSFISSTNRISLQSPEFSSQSNNDGPFWKCHIQLMSVTVSPLCKKIFFHFILFYFFLTFFFILLLCLSHPVRHLFDLGIFFKFFFPFLPKLLFFHPSLLRLIAFLLLSSLSCQLWTETF